MVPITYFSDVLCVWAFIAQLRVDEVKTAFDGQVSLELRFCSVFGDTARKIATQWGGKGGYDAFNDHLLRAAEKFPEVTLNPDIWRTVRPASSTGPHLFLKAAQLAEDRGQVSKGTAEKAMWAMRSAFFRDARDIAQWQIQREVAACVDADIRAIEALIQSGSAFAALASDYHDAASMGIQGSPTFVLNDGRQKLYGDVGYRIIEANIQELIRDPHPDHASWC
ncbi:MAG TPA: DsbA family protein [Caulobacteraceae bacterium]|nr:DsbA family protein [Caulobacteraceae bacterium]